MSDANVPRPAEDLNEVMQLFAEAVERQQWTLAEEAIDVAVRIADYAARHGERVDG